MELPWDKAEFKTKLTITKLPERLQGFEGALSALRFGRTFYTLFVERPSTLSTDHHNFMKTKGLAQKMTFQSVLRHRINNMIKRARFSVTFGKNAVF